MNTRYRFPKILPLLFAPLLASASIIPIVNPSFETLPIGGLSNPSVAGPYSIGVDLPGWTSSNNANSGAIQFVTGPSGPMNAADDGATSAWVRQDTTLSQTLDVSIVPGVTYTFFVDIGWRNDKNANGTADLLINGTKYTAVGSPLVQGEWTTYGVSYLGTAADAGSSITIELNADTLAANTQGNFDNVRLSDSLPDPAPEPALYGMVGACLIGLGALARRKRVS